MVRKHRILVVDDDPAVLRFVCANLRADGYGDLAASNGEEAIELIEREQPDLVILDLMLPGLSGLEVCKRVRQWSDVPILMLSARGAEDDKVECLEAGADDYLSKPFGVRELLARVKALLRRTQRHRQPAPPAVFRSGDLEVDLARYRVTVRGQEIKLTPTEFRLLQEFVLNAGKVLTHTHLLSQVWGPEYADEHSYLHVFVRRLRKQIEPDPDNPRHIVTIPGVGYRLQE